ncbi:universal stress protein [Micromonospora sp. WMMD1102]|uniref:universal stress protein n=1 Tax=Micromonospora sp. WMMD1102 TaxID=3016105 RepID=UPI0024154F46|nr:universal stress protein [Micromonospora sp. WMMD1102]MDG4786692.1 universal stress protein [Micromonospora sp. WMMD1102]
MNAHPIVVGYDASDGARAALSWALAEAARTGAQVTLLFAFEWPAVASTVAPVATSWPDQGAREDARKMLDSAILDAFQTHPRVVVTGTVQDGPAAVLLREQSRQARLLVLGSRGHGGFTGLLLGSTTVAVSAHAHCPVVVVRGERERPDGPVVVGVDGSPGAQLALEYAFAQAAARDAELRVVRAWTPIAPRWQPPGYGPEEQAAVERAELDRVLTDGRSRYPQVRVTVEVTPGPAGRVVVDASRDAQLVIVGTRGHGGFGGLLLGSISQQLLHHAHCPVAVVRELASVTD